MALRFKHIMDPTGYGGGLWASLDKGDPYTVAVYEVDFWEDMDPGAIPTHGKYNVQSGYVYLFDPDDTPAALSLDAYYLDAVNALRSSGWELVGARALNTAQLALPATGVPHGNPAFAGMHPWDVFCPYTGDTVASFADFDTWRYCLVECLWSYGAKDVVCDVSGNNRRELIREAKGEL